MTSQMMCIFFLLIPLIGAFEEFVLSKWNKNVNFWSDKGLLPFLCEFLSLCSSELSCQKRSRVKGFFASSLRFQPGFFGEVPSFTAWLNIPQGMVCGNWEWVSSLDLSSFIYCQKTIMFKAKFLKVLT